MKFVIDKAIPFIEGVLEPYGEVCYLDGPAIGPADIKDADALLIRTRSTLTIANYAESISATPPAATQAEL